MIPIIERDSAHPYPPVITEATRPFWEGLREGRFRVTKGTSGSLTFPPRPFDRDTLSRDVTWTDVSGKGLLYSVTEVHAAPTAFAGESPYCVCIVDLVEGIRLATRLLGPVSTPLDSPVQLVAIKYSNAMTYSARPFHG